MADQAAKNLPKKKDQAAKKVTLKLLIDRKNDAVLFAEAGKDFVDFLFHILALPIGTVVRLLSKTGMVGSLGNLYDSIESLNDTYCIQPSSGNIGNVKDGLLKPNTPTYSWGTASSDVPLLLPPELTSSDDSKATKYYRCPVYSYASCYDHVAMSPSAVCPTCKSKMTRAITFVEAVEHKVAPASVSTDSGDGNGGYVKGVVTYMVMEDLVVKPMSTISSITLLNKFNVSDLNSLEERLVVVGMNEGVALLKASLQSKTVLTDVFLSGKKKKAV